MKNKKGNILLENIIFIILNVLFITILVIFLFTKTGSVAVLEEKYAKEIALIIDSAESDMTVFIEMEDAIKAAENEGFPAGKIVTINENIVTVRLREKGGYSYSFFNDIKPNGGFDTKTKKRYVFVFEKND